MAWKKISKDPVFTVSKNLPFRIYVAYGLGHILNDVCAAMWFSYLLVFFHLVLKFKNNEAGALLLVGQVADAIATPIIGYHSDKDHSCWLYRFGRRKVWYFIGTICVLATFPFIFAPCIGCQNTTTSLQMVYYSFFIIIFQFGWASVQISHMALIPEITPREHQRTKLAAIRSGATVVASIFVYLVTWGVLGMSGGSDKKINPDDVKKFQIIVWSIMSFGIVCSVIFYFNIKEQKTMMSCDEHVDSETRSNIKDLFKNYKVYLVAVIYMSSRLFLNLTQVFISLYLDEALDMVANALAIIPLAMYVASFIASLPIGVITKHIGRKLTYLLGTVIGLVACVWIQFGEGDSYKTYLIFLVVALLGAATTIVLVSSFDITTELIGVKTNSGAFIYGIMSFADKLSNGITVEIIQHFHNDETNTAYYKNVMTYACGGAVLMGAIAVLLLNSNSAKTGEEGPKRKNIETIS
ncbi:major facilitator superfamily domain-containing protein 12-like [Rhynchophorus ferrugineus]|uniref:major facilitator superfamily domain-containing protein 12-like n=1 Tax=Rhynchophorus ferrugineus TaxID=354439 RepID=UPI003FCC2E20